MTNNNAKWLAEGCAKAMQDAENFISSHGVGEVEKDCYDVVWLTVPTGGCLGIDCTKTDGGGFLAYKIVTPDGEDFVTDRKGAHTTTDLRGAVDFKGHLMLLNDVLETLMFEAYPPDDSGEEAMAALLREMAPMRLAESELDIAVVQVFGRFKNYDIVMEDGCSFECGDQDFKTADAATAVGHLEYCISELEAMQEADSEEEQFA